MDPIELRRTSDTLPSIGSMDFDRHSKEATLYQAAPGSGASRNMSAAPPVSPMTQYAPLPSSTSLQYPTLPLSNSSQAGYMSPPNSRRTSENEDESHKMKSTLPPPSTSRQSLPSLSEVMYEQPSASASYSQSTPISATQPQFPSIPSTPVERTRPHVQIPNQSAQPVPQQVSSAQSQSSMAPTMSVSRNTSIPSATTPTLNTHPSERQDPYARQSIHHGPSPQEHGFARPGRPEVKYEPRYESSNPNMSTNYSISGRGQRRSSPSSQEDHYRDGASSQASSQVAERPPRDKYQSSPTANHTPYYNSGHPQEYPYAPRPDHPTSQPRSEHHGQPPHSADRMNSYGGDGPYTVHDDAYSPAAKPNSKISSSHLHYEKAINRALDISDLRRELDLVRENSSYLYHFAMQYTPQNPQAGPQAPKFTGQMDPSLHILDEAIHMAHRSTQALQFWRERVLADQNRKQEQQMNAMKSVSLKRPLDEVYEPEYGDDKNGILQSDMKKRRGKAAPPGRCHSCHRAETPEWRRGPDGARTLCNACGLHYAKLTRKLNKNQNPKPIGSPPPMRKLQQLGPPGHPPYM